MTAKLTSIAREKAWWLRSSTEPACFSAHRPPSDVEFVGLVAIVARAGNSEL